MNALSRILLVSAVAALPLTASASLFKYEDLNANSNGPIGDKLETLTTTFDTVSNQFTFDVEFNEANAFDSFWLVVNSGGNPKGKQGLAIMYGDLTNNLLTTYEYNGANKSDSYMYEDFLSSDPLTSSANGFSIDLDASDINDALDPGCGICFGEKIGVWFHAAKGASFGYDDIDGSLREFDFEKQGWVDFGYKDTTVVDVPEPGSLALLGLGLIGLRLARKKA